MSPSPRAQPPRRERLELDDFRHFKRLADDRFGNYSRLIQFCVVGASGMVVDLSSYALFQLLFSRTWLAGVTVPVFRQSLSLAAAGALAIALALVWNFALNRRLTFNDARRGSLVRQFLTYALGNALGIALSFSMRLILPRHFAFFHDHRLAAAVVGIVAATGISFSMSRWVVFGRRAAKPVRVRRLAESPSALAESLPLVLKRRSLARPHHGAGPIRRSTSARFAVRRRRPRRNDGLVRVQAISRPTRRSPPANLLAIARSYSRIRIEPVDPDGCSPIVRATLPPLDRR